MLQNAPFRGLIFKIFFALGGKGALTPLTKILQTLVGKVMHATKRPIHADGYTAWIID